jgi:homocysteine S-methyltransferase
MGTLLYARGVSLDACFDVLNLNNPRVVQSIHADYIAAGADCIETNTFGANRFKLAVHGLEHQVREINRRGVALARDVRESSGRDVFVLGSIGPLGKCTWRRSARSRPTRRGRRFVSRLKPSSRAVSTRS